MTLVRMVGNLSLTVRYANDLQNDSTVIEASLIHVGVLAGYNGQTANIKYAAWLQTH